MTQPPEVIRRVVCLPPEQAPSFIPRLPLARSWQQLFSGGAPPLERALVLFSSLIEVVSFLHSQGVVHRGLCPSHLHLDEEGTLYVTGFERSVQLGDEAMERLSPSPYTAPEQCSLGVESNLLEPRSDLYSLGAILYELLTGAAPFAQKSGPALLLALLSEDISPPQGCSESLSSLCLRLLSKDSQERPGSIVELREAFLAALLDAGPSLAVPPKAGAGQPLEEVAPLDKIALEGRDAGRDGAGRLPLSAQKGSDAPSAMRLTQGSSLDVLLTKAPTLEERLSLLSSIISACESLAVAHSKGIIHRDLKPQQIIVGAFKETIVTGWDAAKESLPEGFTNEERSLESMAYLSPEQVRGDPIDARANVYSLGAILYHLLTGQAPYGEKRRVELLTALLAGAPAPIQEMQPRAPKALIDITHQAMSRLPKDRFSDASSLVYELKRYQANQLLGENPYSTRELFWRWYKQSRLWVAAGLSLVVTVILGMMIDNLLVRLQAAETNRQKRRALEGEALATLRVDTIFAEKEEQKKRLEELKISQAIAWLDVDPFMSLTWLKELDRELPNQPLGLARVIAFAAEFRGLPRAVLGASWSTPECISQTNSQRMAFSSEGDRIFSGESDGALRIWMLKTQQCATIQAHSGAINKIALSPDGLSLVSVGQDGAVLLWNTTYWKKTVLARESGPVQDVTFSPDGSMIAWGGASSAVSIWSTIDEALVSTLEVTTRGVPVSSLAFHPKGHQLSVLRADMTLQTWDVKTNKKILERGRGAPTQRAALLYSPDGSSLVSVEEGARSFYVVDTKTKRERRGDSARELSAAAISPGSRWLATADIDGALSLWDLRSNKLELLRSFRAGRTRVSSMQFSLDGDALILGGDDGVVRVVSLLGEPVSAFLGHGAAVSQVTLSRSGAWVASSSLDHTIRVWDLSKTRQIEGHPRRISDLVFSSKGEELLTISEDKTVRAWSVSGALLRSFSAPQISRMRRAIFSPGGYWVATVNDDNTAYLRSINGKEAKLLHTFAQPPTGLDFSGDGNSLWISSLEGTITRWEIPTGKRMTTIQARGTPEEKGLTGIILLPGELSAVTSSYGGVLQLWDIRKESPIEAQTLRTNLRDMQMAISKNGRYIAAIGDTSAVILWDLEKNQSRELWHHRGAARDVAFIAHDTFITAGAEGDLRVWDANTGRSVTLPIGVSVESVTMDQQSSTLAFATGARSVWLREISFLSVTELDGWLQGRRLPQKRTL